jgi:hypothetical protein
MSHQTQDLIFYEVLSYLTDQDAMRFVSSCQLLHRFFECFEVKEYFNIPLRFDENSTQVHKHLRSLTLNRRGRKRDVYEHHQWRNKLSLLVKDSAFPLITSAELYDRFMNQS